MNPLVFVYDCLGQLVKIGMIRKLLSSNKIKHPCQHCRGASTVLYAAFFFTLPHSVHPRYFSLNTVQSDRLPAASGNRWGSVLFRCALP